MKRGAVTERETPDAWGELNSRYRHDERAQFLLFVEQLSEAEELIRSGQITKLRIALVSIDNLAEVLLHRQMRRAQSIGEEGWVYDVPRLGGSDLREFKMDFGARVRFARKKTGDPLLETVFTPLLDEGGEAVFRVAHAYRNRVYHADHHNPTVLPLVTRAYFDAVRGAFIRFQPTPKSDQAVDGLGQGLAVELAEAKQALSADLVWRADWADEMIVELSGDGLGRERVESGLHWMEFWEELTVRDGEIVKLANEIAKLWNVTDDDEKGSTEKRMSELGKRRDELVRERWRTFVPKLQFGEIEQVRRLGQGLGSAASVGALFTRYRRLDEQIERFERFLDEMAIGWDRHNQEEVDRLREERIAGRE